MKTIITIPPYATYVKNAMKKHIVSGARLNTVMPLKGSLEDELKRIKTIADPKDVWLDLKCRQMRISKGYFYNAPKKPIVLDVQGKKVLLDPSNPKAKGSLATPPWSMIEIDHKIKLDTTKPVKCYFSDGYDTAHVAKVDGNKLIMLDGPKKVVGSGESINILHPSLEIEGYFTDTDKKYIEAAKKVGMHNYMLSYVEQESDITDLLKRDPDAKILAKIESNKGLDFVDKVYPKYKGKINLMAARGDLYVEVGRPHKILTALRKISEADPEAVVASRLFTGLRQSPYPSCQEICDVGFLREIGYKNYMIGDDICFDEDSLMSSINIMEAIKHDYKPKNTQTYQHKRAK